MQIIFFFNRYLSFCAIQNIYTNHTLCICYPNIVLEFVFEHMILFLVIIITNVYFD